MKHELTGSGGKGSAPRAVDKAKFDEGFDRIFGNKCEGCERKRQGMYPSHNGSAMCKSGSIASGGNKAHCTCDVCF